MLITKTQNSQYILGIWKLTESTEYLLSLLPENIVGESLDKSYKLESRLKEKAAVRVLLQTLLGEQPDLDYLPSGKPFLLNCTQNVSISHTHSYVAVILSKSSRLGIDIESFSDRVLRIRSRFISDSEYIDPKREIKHLLLHWSAKETMYKALGEEGLTLQTDLLLEYFDPVDSGVMIGKELFTQNKYSFEIEYLVTEDYVLTFTV